MEEATNQLTTTPTKVVTPHKYCLYARKSTESDENQKGLGYLYSNAINIISLIKVFVKPVNTKKFCVSCTQNNYYKNLYDL